jgi:peptidoglycan/LPS O-acetylase OafA/YrhL
MNPKQRLSGVDLFRGIAAFAVVILHSDEVIDRFPEGWPLVLKFSAFAVPFFLATSFYLMVEKLYDEHFHSMQWTKRLSRLLVPYAFWSILYLGIRISRHLLKHQAEKIQSLFENWPGLIFLGRSEFHLYFIPLLIIGIFVIISTESLIRNRLNLSLSLLLLLLSLVSYHLYGFFLDSSSPNFIFLGTTAIQCSGTQKNGCEPLIYSLKIIGFLVRCLPYITAAIVLNHSAIKSRVFELKANGLIVFLIAFIVFNTFPLSWLPKVIIELSKGYITLVLAIIASKYIHGISTISSLGRCSFGIYLMHLLILQFLWSSLQKIGVDFNHISFLMLMTTVIFTFTISWLATFFLMKQKRISSLIFGS